MARVEERGALAAAKGLAEGGEVGDGAEDAEAGGGVGVVEELALDAGQRDRPAPHLCSMITY